MSSSRLLAQLEFIRAIDDLKSVNRRSYLINNKRVENTAEHSWHVAMLAMTLAEHAAAPVNTDRVVRMMLVHDIVEIDAGDTFCYDTDGYEDKAEREQAAADRLFGLLPADQGAAMRALWDEFEARETADARFAAGLDRLMPLIHNYETQGRCWQEHGVTRSVVVARNEHMAEGSPELWKYTLAMIEDAVARGYLPDDKEIADE